MSHEYDEIRFIASQLSAGETRGGTVCPFCHGGRTGEASFSVTKTTAGYSLYVCHRARCDRKGRVGHGIGFHDKPAQVKPEFEPRIYDGTFEREVPADVADYFYRKYGWSCEGHCGWDARDQRTVWEVRSALGAIRGYELRKLDGQGRTKTLHYRHSPDPWVGWYGWQESAPRVALVEDAVSATRIAEWGVTAASLMGSHLNEDRVIEIAKLTNVELCDLVLALDRDAYEKSLGFVQRFSFLLPNMRSVRLERDAKYLNDNELASCFCF